MLVLKIGGSLATRKHRPYTPDLATVRRLAGECGQAAARSRRSIIVVHGTGSFGKPPAVEFGYLDGRLAGDRVAVVSRVEGVLDELRRAVVDQLRDAGLSALRVDAVSHFRVDGGRLVDADLSAVAALLARGVTPVLSGAIVPDRAGGFSVLSSDNIAARAAIDLAAERLVFATDVPGVLAADGTLIERVPAEHDGAMAVVSGDALDVTGAMSGKLGAARAAADLGVQVTIVDGTVPGRVRDSLCGEWTVGTQLWAGRRERASTAGGEPDSF